MPAHPEDARILAAFHGYYTPLAEVTLKVVSPDVPIGIFGHYKTLTLLFDSPLGNITVWGQDLAGDEARDITSEVTIEDNRLILPGELIARTGTSAAQAGDISEPGMVLAIR